MRSTILVICSVMVTQSFLSRLVKCTLEPLVEDDNGHFINEWAVHIPGGDQHVKDVAREHGYTIVGQIGNLDNIYLLKKDDVPIRSKRDAGHHTLKLNEDKRVLWVEQQVAKVREKRGYTNMKLRPSGSSQTSKRQNGVVQPSQDNLTFNDPQYPDQWYLHSSGSYCSLPGLDLNVLGVWAMGYTGKDVVVSILDDGLEWNHTDIIQNYDSDASYDYNDRNADPTPRYDNKGTNKHGTRCAGEVSMMANNKKCGVGVAYDSKIGGIRLLDGVVTDALEALSVGHNCSHVSIYSASWGPTDNGQTLDGPGKLTRAALERCINKGRHGLGSIYVWASGNGGEKGDNCDCDGYTSSIYTISIGSVSEYGTFPWYGEMCASTMACTVSGGAYLDHKISTIDLRNRCTNGHSGTSAAAPLAAGIFALVLQANPRLTWRDCQHLLVCTAESTPIRKNPGWQTNGLNLKFNQRFGFGMMNAERMVKTALTWVNVPEKTSCDVSHNPMKVWQFQSPGRLEIEFDVDRCLGVNDLQVNYLEHVQVRLNMACSRRGAISIQLISPNGTVSDVLNPRKADKATGGFRNWTFMSVHMWGESPYGKWILVIVDDTSENNSGFLNDATLILHGTQDVPHYRKDGIVKCGQARKLDTPSSCKSLYSGQNDVMRLIKILSGRQ